MYEYSVMTTNDSAGDKNFLNNSNCYYNNNNNNKNQPNTDNNDSTLNNSADSNFNAVNYYNNTLSVVQDAVKTIPSHDLNVSLTKSDLVNKNGVGHSTTNKTTNPYGDNLLSSTLNQLDKEHLCHKSYFDNLPPEIEISVYGSETLPENSVLEAENTVNTSGADTDDTATAAAADRRALRNLGAQKRSVPILIRVRR